MFFSDTVGSTLAELLPAPSLGKMGLGVPTIIPDQTMVSHLIGP